MTLNRRQFLSQAATGSALVTLPSLFAGCSRSATDHAVTSVPSHVMTEAQTQSHPYLEWFGVTDTTIRKVMAELNQHGADAADLYFQHARTNSIAYQDGIINRASTSVDQGVGLRVVIGDQVGYAYTEDLSLEAMQAAARSAAAIAKTGHGSRIEIPARFATVSRPSYYELNVPWADVGVDRKLPLIQRTAELAKAADPSIDKVQVYWADGEERVLLVDLAGNLTTDFRPMTRLSVNVTATKNGVTQSHGSNIAARESIDWYTDQRLADVVQEAVDRTMILFEAKRPPAGELPVVLAAGASGILLHEAIGHGMEADFNRKNVSIYAEMLGKKIAPDFVTIVDDGTVENHRGALNVDDEGKPCGKTVLVENGILASYLHDSISAKHYNLPSTGSGRRESFRHPPMPRMRCTYMLDGPHSRDEIIGSVEKGIVAETFTNGQVQIGAGDFTFYIKNGWLIENGKITAPIKDCNIIGNGPEALRNVTMAANDSKLDTGGWTCGKDGQSVPVSQGLPTVLVSQMTVGGTNG